MKQNMKERNCGIESCCLRTWSYKVAIEKQICICKEEEMERVYGKLDDAAQGIGLYLKRKKGSMVLDSAEDAFAKKRGKNL